MAHTNGRSVPVVLARPARPRREYWRGLLEECRQSGLSQAEFCRRRGIPPGTLGYWKCILARATPPRRRPAGSGSRPPAFLPVRVVASPPRPEAAAPTRPLDGRGELEIALGAGRVVRIRGQVDAAWLGQVLTVLEAARC